MNSVRDVAVFVGSVRKDSINRKVAHALAELAPSRLALGVVEIADLPLIQPGRRTQSAGLVDGVSQARQGGPGTAVRDPRTQPFDASRDQERGGRWISSLRSKRMERQARGCYQCFTRCHWGGFGANHHLRQSLAAVNVPTMPQPEAYLGGADRLFDAGGKLSNDATRTFLRGFMEAFAGWIAANTKA